MVKSTQFFGMRICGADFLNLFAHSALATRQSCALTGRCDSSCVSERLRIPDLSHKMLLCTAICVWKARFLKPLVLATNGRSSKVNSLTSRRLKAWGCLSGTTKYINIRETRFGVLAKRNPLKSTTFMLCQICQ